jgi:uncharacterized membrane protein HdeD (DUF308 family)
VLRIQHKDFSELWPHSLPALFVSGQIATPPAGPNPSYTNKSSCYLGIGRPCQREKPAMTSVSQAQVPDGPAVQTLRSKSGWIVTLGVVYVIAGLIALSSVVFATKVTVFVVGIMMLISGVAEVINAFQFKSWGKFLVWLLLGLLYIVAGLLTFENPLLAATILTLLLGVSLVFSGVARIVLAFSMREGMSWTSVVLSGVVTLLLGLIILAHWPVSSLFVLGMLLGIDLLIIGIGWIFVGFGLKSRA